MIQGINVVQKRVPYDHKIPVLNKAKNGIFNPYKFQKIE